MYSVVVLVVVLIVAVLVTWNLIGNRGASIRGGGRLERHNLD